MTTRIPVEKLSDGLLKKYCSGNYTHFSDEQSVQARLEYKLDLYDAAIGIYRDSQNSSNYKILVCLKGLLIVDEGSTHYIAYEKISKVPFIKHEMSSQKKLTLEYADGKSKAIFITGKSNQASIDDVAVFYQFFDKILFWYERKRELQKRV